MSEYAVPVSGVEVNIHTEGGDTLHARVFLPMVDREWDPPQSLETWLNGSEGFFPIELLDGSGRLVLNREKVAALSSARQHESDIPARCVAVKIECAREIFVGTLRIQMPAGRRRVLDYLNDCGRFVPLYDGARCHLIRRDLIQSVTELEGDIR